MAQEYLLAGSFVSKARGLGRLGICLTLSLIYALASQVSFYTPFSCVPVSLQPLPILIFSFLLGPVATYSYLLYLIQGALGAPVFASFNGGIFYIMGPTGGYLLGFLAASVFLSFFSKRFLSSAATLMLFTFSHAIVFACGLLQLLIFYKTNNILAVGVYPFIVGDVCKIVVATILVSIAAKK